MAPLAPFISSRNSFLVFRAPAVFLENFNLECVSLSMDADYNLNSKSLFEESLNSCFFNLETSFIGMLTIFFMSIKYFDFAI